MKLLLVEDVLAYARALRVLLRGNDEESVTLHHVETLAGALVALEHEPWDCVLLDVHLPDAEGIECVDRLRARDSSTALVVLTGYDDRELALEALRRGAQEYAVKGEHAPEDLLRIIRHAIERNRLVNALNEQRTREVRAAHHDAVTGLPNRQLLAERARDLLGQSVRDGMSAALLYLDLDGFKAVNDRHGHDAGDQVLAAVARTLLESVRSPDVVARVGGDEFVVLLASVNDAQEAERAADRIVQRIGELREVGSIAVAIGASAGVALFPAHGERLEELVSRADAAMYAAKRGGKNAVRVYGERDAALRASANADDGHYMLSYQPWLHIGTERVGGVEALLSSPTSGESAIGLLESSERRGEIAALGRWVLRRALRQWRDWRVSGFLPQHVSINVSAAELREGSFAAMRLQMLSEMDIDPRVLQLEIAEDTLLEADGAALTAIEALRAHGVRIIADNVGRTRAALVPLSRIPLDGFKLDLHLLPAIVRGEKGARAIASGILAAAGALGVPCCAVGVESSADLAACRDLGVPFVQGYWVGRPQHGDACLGLRAHT